MYIQARYTYVLTEGGRRGRGWRSRRGRVKRRREGACLHTGLWVGGALSANKLLMECGILLVIYGTGLQRGQPLDQNHLIPHKQSPAVYIPTIPAKTKSQNHIRTIHTVLAPKITTPNHQNYTYHPAFSTISTVPVTPNPNQPNRLETDPTYLRYPHITITIPTTSTVPAVTTAATIPSYCNRSIIPTVLTIIIIPTLSQISLPVHHQHLTDCLKCSNVPTTTILSIQTTTTVAPSQPYHQPHPDRGLFLILYYGLVLHTGGIITRILAKYLDPSQGRGGGVTNLGQDVRKRTLYILQIGNVRRILTEPLD
jgi:hypothetical protein